MHNEALIANDNVKSIEDLESFTWGKQCLGWFLCDKDNISVVYEKMPPNTEEVKHYHEHTWQFFFITRGQAVMNVNGVNHLMKQYQFTEIPSGVSHQISNVSGADLEFLVISMPNRPVNDRVEVR